MNAITPIHDRDIMTAESGTVALLARAEVDVQISTAQRFPRSLTTFRREMTEMVTLNEQIASECIYALPRDGKTVEGPSARFAEIVASAWGNCRAGARVVAEGAEFITAQGVFHDLQRNVAITYEVQRRITNSSGKRYKPDMIGVTGNAASSIALRNAILKGVPKAFWSDMYDAARRMAKGDVKTLANRRSEALKAFQGYGVTPAQIYELLGIRGEDDISLDHLLTLRGIITAIKEGDTTPEDAFPAKQPPRPPKPSADEPAKAAPTAAQPAAPAPEPPQPAADTLDYTQLLEALSNEMGSCDDATALDEAWEQAGWISDAPAEVLAEGKKIYEAEKARIARQAEPSPPRPGAER